MYGTTGFGINFDPKDDPPSSFMSFSSLGCQVNDTPWKDMTLVVPASSLADRGRLAVRSGNLWGTYDIKTYDVGNLFYVNEGTPGTYAAALGLLAVEYEVELIDPVIQDGVGGVLTTTPTGPSNFFGLKASWRPDSEAILPFEYYDANSIYFNQNFEGQITVLVSGSGISSPQIVSQTFGTYAGTTMKTQFNAADGDLLFLVSSFAVRAPMGSRIGFSCSASSLTFMTMTVTRAGFDQLDYDVV